MVGWGNMVCGWGSMVGEIVYPKYYSGCTIKRLMTCISAHAGSTSPLHAEMNSSEWNKTLHELLTAKMVVNLLKEPKTILVDVLFGGLCYGTLQPHCARMRMASVPRLNYRLLPSFCLCNYLQKLTM